MKTICNYALILLLLAFFPNRASAQTNRDQELHNIIRIANDWSDQIEKKDVAATAAYYEPEARAGFNLQVKGLENIKNEITKQFAVLDFREKWVVKHAGISESGDLAYLTLAYTTCWRVEDGGLKTFNGTALQIWRRQADGSWKVYLDKF